MSLLECVLIVLVAVVVGISLMLFARRRAPDGSWFHDGDRASGVFGVLAFAASAAFVALVPVLFKLRAPPFFPVAAVGLLMLTGVWEDVIVWIQVRLVNGFQVAI